MKKAIVSILFFTLTISSGFSQRNNTSFSRQISILFENDFLGFRGTDGYYTNGTSFNLAMLRTPKRAKVLKRINSYELGQKLFTPGLRETYVVREIDRPITGYLYGQALFSRFLNNNKMYQYGASAGTIGPNSLARQILDIIHPLGGINSEYWDWMYEYQLNNEAGVNLHGSYAFSLVKEEDERMIQITPVSKATVGTLFANFSQSVLLQFGKHNRMHEGAMWNSRLQSSDKQKLKYELFVYYQPEVVFQAYNATVNGGLFNKSKGSITSGTKSLLTNYRLGVMFANNRYTAGFSITYQGREAESQVNRHSYGSINLSYRFK